MGWTLGGIRVLITDFSEAGKNIISRLQPLSGGTVLQKFGYENYVYKLQGFIVGETDRAALKALSSSGTLQELRDFDNNLIANVYVNSVSLARIPSTAQDLRPDLPCDAPVYRVDIELYE